MTEDLHKSARIELARRARLQAATGRAFSIEAFCGDHAKQLAACRDRSNWIHLLCARQSGKTWADDGILLDNALLAPRSTNLFLGLVGTGVRTSNWFPVWKPLCERSGIPDDWHNETEMRTTFDNGARVMFGGTDDLKNVRKYLGNRLDNSVIIIDEAQDQPPEVLSYILRVLLVPMLTSTSRVILSGVLPDVPAGLFLDLAEFDPETKTGGKGAGWSHHSWGRAANVHTPEAMQVLAKYMADHGLTEDDPQIQRDYYMRRRWDLSATAYRYDRARSGYSGEPPDWLENFSVGIDPGAKDRAAIQVWGWGSREPNVYHVHEWVTGKNADTTWSQIAAELQRINERWSPHAWYYDAGGSQMTLDLFQRDYGIPVVKAANKNDLAGQVARMADLIALGRAKVRIGSALEEDLQRAQWDKDARAKGLYRWSSAWHPDAADAARYALAGYWDAFEEQPPMTPEAERLAVVRAEVARVERDRRMPAWVKQQVQRGAMTQDAADEFMPAAEEWPGDEL